MYITITGMNHYLGMDAFCVHQIVTLEKEASNNFDSEAIKVLISGGAQVGYVANSIYTKAKGTSSAGYIYRDFKEQINAKILFITQDAVIAELILKDGNHIV